MRARKAFFDVLAHGGIVVEQGELDARGKPFTAASIKELRRRVDDALWQILEDRYVIEGDVARHKKGSTA